MTTTRENLIAGRNRIANPSALIKRDSARDVHGFTVACHDPRAVCWCAVAAVLFDNAATFALVAALPHGEDSVVAYNDMAETTHADIMAVYDRAIASLSEDVP